MDLSSVSSRNLLDELVLRGMIPARTAIRFLHAQERNGKYRIMAEQWVARHPQWFGSIVSQIRSLSPKKGKFSLRVITEAARSADDKGISISNSLVKNLRGIIVEEYPELKGILK